MAAIGFQARHRELALLDDELTEVASGRLGVVLIEGDGGIGKTRLASEAAALAGRRGFAAFFGGAEEVGGRPFGPLVDALGCRSRSADPDRVEIAGMLAGGVEGHDPGLQYRVIDAVLDLVEREALDRPALLVLDDLQWADASTLLALRTAVNRLEFVPLLTIGLLRPSPRSRELDRLVDALTRDGARHIELGPLAEDEVVSLVREALGADPGPRLTEVLAGAAGNPLFVVELLTVLRSEGAVEVKDGLAEADTPSLPSSLRVTLLRRIGYLSEPTLEVLRLAAVLRGSFLPSELQAATGRPLMELVPLIDEARQAGILVEDGSLIRFRHDLIREAVYDDLGEGVRAALHVEVARRLAEVDAPVLRVAEQYSLGSTVGDTEAVRWLRRAAHDTVSTDPAAAIGLIEQAIELAPAGAERQDLAADLATFHAFGGSPAEAERIARDTLSGGCPAFTEGRTRTALVHALFVQGQWAGIVEEVEVAVGRQAVDDTTRGRLLAEAALARIWTGDAPGAERDAQEAVRLGEAAGDPVAVSVGLGHLSPLASMRGDLAEGVTLARRALEVAERGGAEAERRHPHMALGMALMSAGELRESVEVLAEGRRLGERAGTVWDLPLYHAMLAQPLHLLGDWDESVAAAEASLSLADETGVQVGSVSALCVIADIAVHRGDLRAAARSVNAAEALLQASGPQWGTVDLAFVQAYLAAAHQDSPTALAILRELYSGGQVDGFLHVLGPTLAHLTCDQGLRAEIADRVEAAAARTGAAKTTAGALLCRGLADDDPEAALQAAEQYRAAERRPDVAAAWEDAAGMLARAGRSDEARAVFEDALSEYERLGAVRDVARVTSAMRAAGIRRGSRQPRVRAMSGWESLTPAELGVARLVAERLTNPEIAERLFISRATVKTHLVHIFAKLDVKSRRELGHVASRHEPEQAPVTS